MFTLLHKMRIMTECSHTILDLIIITEIRITIFHNWTIYIALSLLNSAPEDFQEHGCRLDMEI